MRILSVRLRNLNSLTGEWLVDFTHPDYGSNGIFAITGPTGAGKTTILDALCLGLYGRTPRLDKVTKSGNEIMSRQTGDCFAEVTFETQKGRYRSHWSQHRARKKPAGELQPAKHEVADAGTGAVLESRITQVSAFIEEATGMDFERFTRSMMLAQGGFSAFLAASPDERAPILEQITGTGIYSDISIKVHERRAEERGRLDELQAGMRGIRVLTDDEERALHAALEENLGREKEFGDAGQFLRKAAAWREGIERLEKDLLELEGRWKDFGERRQAFKPEEERLIRSGKALGLEGDYRAVLALRTLQESEIKELKGDLAKTPEKEEAAAKAIKARDEALKTLQETRARQALEAEIIKEVRDLDTRVAEQKKRLDDANKALQAAGRKAEAHKTDMKDMGQTRFEAKADLERVHEYQAAHAADASLVANLALIERGFSSLEEMETAYAKACTDFAGAEEARKTSADRTRKAEEENARVRQKFETSRSGHTILVEGLATLLEGRGVGEWRDESAVLQERERLLTRVAATIEKVKDARKTLENMRAGLAELIARHETAALAIHGETGKKSLLEKEVQNLEVRLTLLNRIRDLEEERKRLQDGAPCPLCGATDHPYARGNVPELSNVEAALKKGRTALKETSANLNRMEAEQARTEQKILHGEKEIAEKEAARNKDEEACLADLALLGIQASPEDLTRRVSEELSAVRATLAGTSRIITAADAMEKEEKAARNALEALRVRLETSDRALQDMRLTHQSIDLEYGQRKEQCDALGKEVHKARTSVLKDLEPFGITDLRPGNLSALLTNLTDRCNSWLAGLETKTALEKKVQDLTAEIDKEEALLTNLQREIAVREEERDNIMRSCQALEASRRERYGDKDPGEEEKALALALDRAEHGLEKAREEHGIKDKELSALKERIEALSQKTGARANDLAQADGRLALRVATAGFAGMEDYLSSRLSDEEREALEERQKSLTNEETGLVTRRKDKAAALAAEVSKELSPELLATLLEKLGATESELKEIRLRIGSISGSLAENAKEKERQKEAMEIVEAQKKECSRWDDLHLLIGSADGKKFRNFAQGLTFEIMTVHANRRLREMTDRYVLIRDQAEPLELNVIDNYQAGEVRSTKNLSGGESFIVSLALALGLSQMASRKVRVDSLFLDEGFGSLDEDALETALETLAGLKDTGKLIGVISHVPALKERIGTQIQVIPKSGGRSVIAGPGCRRCDEAL